MSQARVLEPENTVYRELLQQNGFRWCKKDRRWEKNGGDPDKQLRAIKEAQPGLQTEIKK